jgi:hypothetical protein
MNCEPQLKKSTITIILRQREYISFTTFMYLNLPQCIHSVSSICSFQNNMQFFFVHINLFVVRAKTEIKIFLDCYKSFDMLYFDGMRSIINLMISLYH